MASMYRLKFVVAAFEMGRHHSLKAFFVFVFPFPSEICVEMSGRVLVDELTLVPSQIRLDIMKPLVMVRVGVSETSTATGFWERICHRMQIYGAYL